MIEVEGSPSRWIVRGGMPADVVLEYGDGAGIPSYESDTGRLHVYSLLLALDSSEVVERPRGAAAIYRKTMLIPADYTSVAARSVLVGDHELCCLYDGADAAWVWRPILHRFDSGLTRLGSQQELEWRWALNQARERSEALEVAAMMVVLQQSRALIRRYGVVSPLRREPGGGRRLGKNARKRLYREYADRVARLVDEQGDLPFAAANARADLILREHLNPQQILDLDASGGFYVCGTLNRLYRVELGNGLQTVDPLTRQPILSMCLHPERWIPHADVALAQKLAIESGPEGEAELLEGARTQPLRRPSPPTADERACWERERHLLPEPLAA